MPSFETNTPVATPKSLARRNARMQSIVACARVTMPGQMILSCRREWLAMTEIVRDSSLDVSERVAALGGAVKVRDQLLELLSIPRRPIAGARATRQVDLATLPAFDLPEMPVVPAQESPIPSVS